MCLTVGLLACSYEEYIPKKDICDPEIMMQLKSIKESTFYFVQDDIPMKTLKLLENKMKLTESQKIQIKNQLYATMVSESWIRLAQVPTLFSTVQSDVTTVDGKKIKLLFYISEGDTMHAKGGVEHLRELLSNHKCKKEILSSVKKKVASNKNVLVAKNTIKYQVGWRELKLKIALFDEELKNEEVVKTTIGQSLVIGPWN